MDISRQVLPLSAVDSPSVLYKYRNWSNELHQSILTNRTVYFAPPSTFEDEKEFRNFKRYDLLNDSQVYEKYLKMSHEHNPNFSRSRHRAYARDMTKRAPFRNPKYLKETQERQFIDYDARVGILSLTEFNNSLAMWKKYANEGKGFCVGIDSLMLFTQIGGGGKVEYPDEGLPIINGLDEWDLERWKQVYNKEAKWNFEQEYRTSIFNINGLSNAERLLALPEDYFKEVVFGWAMEDGSRNEIREVCQTFKVKYFEAQLSKDKLVSIVELVD